MSGRKTLSSFAKLGDGGSRWDNDYIMFCFTILSKINDRSVDKFMLLEELQPTIKRSAMKRSATVVYTPNPLLPVEHASSDAATLMDDTKYVQ